MIPIKVWSRRESRKSLLYLCSGRLVDLHCLNTRTNEWSALETGPMEGRGGTPFAATPGGELYVIGGFAGSECAGRETNDIHKYNIASNKWQTLEEVVLHLSTF